MSLSLSQYPGYYANHQHQWSTTQSQYPGGAMDHHHQQTHLQTQGSEMFWNSANKSWESSSNSAANATTAYPPQTSSTGSAASSSAAYPSADTQHSAASSSPAISRCSASPSESSSYSSYPSATAASTMYPHHHGMIHPHHHRTNDVIRYVESEFLFHSNSRNIKETSN